jgi:ribonuclease HII
MKIKRARLHFPELNEKIICGLDEVGRGPWAGPLVTCAVILPDNFRLKGIKDSKKLKKSERERIGKILEKKAYYGLGVATVEEVDGLGLIPATNIAFIRALKQLRRKKGSHKPDFLVIDGRDKLSLPYPHRTIIKGDEKIKEIAAASILAKVARDAMMVELAKNYPEYGFELHKGYGTDLHARRLKKFGASEIHRKSFAPVARFIKKSIGHPEKSL